MKNIGIVIFALILGFIGGGVGGASVAYYYGGIDTDGGTIFNGEATRVVEESDTITVAAEATKSVVSIVISQELPTRSNQSGFNRFSDFFGTLPADPNVETESVQVGEGSGFIVSADGLILTNRHVVSEEDASYTVIFDDGTTHEAEVLARDILTDLAVLKIDVKDLPALDLGDSDAVVTGQTVLAIGNTLGEYDNSVTKGIVSGLSRNLGGEYSDLIQTDAAISQGNSGGPLLDLAGQVIGVNTAVDRGGEGLGFAIPINEAKIVVDSVQKNGKIVRAALGIRYIPVTETFAENNNLDFDYGAYIRGSEEFLGVVPDSAADKAGLEEGDIILEIDGQKINDDNTLSSLIRTKQIGDTVTVKVYRDGEEIAIDVTLAELPQEE